MGLLLGFTNHCLVQVTRFSLDRCAGIKVDVTCWLKIFSDPNVLGFSHHVFLEGDTQPRERLISQSLGGNIPPAPARVSTLVSEHCALCTTLPPEGPRHAVQCLPPGVAVVLCLPELSTLTHYGSIALDPSFVTLKPPHPPLPASAFTVLVTLSSILPADQPSLKTKLACVPSFHLCVAYSYIYFFFFLNYVKFFIRNCLELNVYLL